MKVAAQLWPHQLEALRVAEQAQKQKRSRVLLQFPPGTGKTECAARLALGFLASRPFSRVLVVVPTTSILQQFRRRLAAETRLTCHVEQAEQHAPPNARLILATQNSLWDRLKKYPPEVLTIYDEAHHGNLDAKENLKIARAFHHIVGLSATPWSSGCRALFGRPTVFLSLMEAQALKDESGRSMLAPLELCDWREPRGPHGLVFCADNASCLRRARMSPGSTFITYDLGQEVVQHRITAWRTGQAPVLFANLIPREGLDEPRCGEVWIEKETESDILAVQMAGRALRWQAGKVARIYCATDSIRTRVEKALQRCNRREPNFDV